MLNYLLVNKQKYSRFIFAYYKNKLYKFFNKIVVLSRFFKIIPGWLLPGVMTSIMIILITFITFNALWHYASISNWFLLLKDRYLWHVIFFTFLQAILSAVCSTLPAIILAKALHRRQFIGRSILLRFCSITTVLPAAVVIFGIISVFGQHGWLAYLCHILNIEYIFSLYGLSGILLTHIFFNLPLATRLLLQALESIPIEQRQLAAQLNITSKSFFLLIEWPYLRRQLLSAMILIFILCFASFAIVLTFGGGPRATTIGLAIYQALNYDFDINRAAFLALLQMVFCLCLTIISQYVTKTLPITHTYNIVWHNQNTSLACKLCDIFIILAYIFLLIPPLIAVIIKGINRGLLKAIQKPELFQAILTSLFIALCAGLLSILLTSMLLWTSRELRLRNKRISAQLLDLSGMVIMVIPGIVVATGFFLLTINDSKLPNSPILIVVCYNALATIPYVLKILENPMQDNVERYWQLCLALNITGFNRLRIVEWSALRQPLKRALAFASVISLEDFGIISLFGSQNFCTLPSYFYQQINSYHTQDSSAIALILLLVCLLLFYFFERDAGINDSTR